MVNEAHTYNESVLREHGMAHHDLFFRDCTVQSVQVIERFLDVCDTAKGFVAVHCLAGVCVCVCVCVCVRVRVHACVCVHMYVV